MIFLYAFAGPFLVWPVEYFLPYPYVIEELFKLLVVAKGPKGAKSWVLYALSGIAFAFSETILYSLNLSNPLQRFGATSLLHAGTFVIIYFFSKVKLAWLGFLIAAATHYLYNTIL